MPSRTGTRLIETRHAFLAEDVQAEQAVLARIHEHFAAAHESQRAAYDAMSSDTPIANGVTIEAVTGSGPQGFWVRPDSADPNRVILYIHGGAYMLGSARAYAGLVSQIASRAGVLAFALDYPLAPESPFPAAYDATVAARRWLSARWPQIALVGDSAGAGLALSSLRERTVVAGHVASVVAFSPWIDLSLTGQSFADPATHDPIFKPEVLRAAASTYLAGSDPKDGRASALYDIPPHLPPIAIQVGRDELLLDDAKRYAAAAVASGGRVELDIYDGMHHVFQGAVGELVAARSALDSAADYVSRMWP